MSLAKLIVRLHSQRDHEGIPNPRNAFPSDGTLDALFLPILTLASTIRWFHNMISVGISNLYSWIMPNRPISRQSIKCNDLQETSKETTRYKYVNTFGTVNDGAKNNQQPQEIPAEILRAYIKELLAARKETNKHDSQKPETGP